ncbi:hypothetical protein OUHCRE12_06830 [Enterobacter kobei]
MIEWIIRRSVANRFLVMMGALFLSIWGAWTIINTPVDALPDLSDVQVIIKTSYPGQAPQIVENQVTYPLTTTMLSVPGAKTVRGFSQFGDSYVYVIFEDGTDLYWARSRVLEYLNQVQGKLPAGVSSQIGPDATGVGWIFEYALVDRSGKHDLAELRSLQDWFLKFELKTIPNVAEVASVGGVVKQYQIQVNPLKLAQYGISLPEVKQALASSNQEAGGSSVEMAEAEYMVRASGYPVPGVVSALAERLEGGRYIDVDINREKAARYGMTVGDVQLFVSSAIGGATVGETVEGVARYPINIRYPQDTGTARMR